MKSKILIASAVLLGASVAVAAPVQAHSTHDHLPLYVLTGLALYGAYTSHDHHHHHGHHDDKGPPGEHQPAKDPYETQEDGRHDDGGF